MLARKSHTYAYRWLAALSLAAYGVFGVFGHSLHGLLPLAEDCCGITTSTNDEPCGCGHEHVPVSTGPRASRGDGVALGAAPSHHDASTCSLCVFLAKLKVGQVALEASDMCAEVSSELITRCETSALTDVLLAFAARGPPAC